MVVTDSIAVVICLWLIVEAAQVQVGYSTNWKQRRKSMEARQKHVFLKKRAFTVLPPCFQRACIPTKRWTIIDLNPTYFRDRYDPYIWTPQNSIVPKENLRSIQALLRSEARFKIPA